ncbi:glycosyltransferase family 1 protein [Methanosarcina sp. MSH10X1]|uniref:glycosyltransferase family 4 protein n=1 Tax=Methanosarcina sp. MSH10X1 TaxID=2507075 RepID=UPI000FFBD137|nr:glycosyltransferase family 4 protein [Methanosarcina sp. MSH10X1]RXA19723.1 glycosyltransferase family 1 protein [Methanosarcina sp. MSH10X1]
MISKNARIFLIYYDYLDSNTGSNTHILELFYNLTKYVDVTLFAPKSQKRLELKNIKYIPHINKTLFIGISYELSLFFYLLYYCLKNKPNVIYLRQNSFSFLPVFICKFFKIPCIIEINGFIRDEALMKASSISVTRSIYYVLSVASEKFNYNHCDKIVSVTQNLKKQIINVYKIPENKVVVINNGANTDLFRPLVKQESLDRLNLDSSYFYVCFVGNLAPWQGVEYLIKASPLILTESPQTHFLVVGDGVMKEEWLQLAENLGVLNKFIFTGSVPYKMVPTYINAADICVVPKKPLNSGYSPLKLYEYMACGRPIVATNTSGFEILAEVNAGILINPENSEEFANSVLLLLDNPEVKNSMGENGRKYVAENHSWDGVARKVLGVCNETKIHKI